MFCSRLASVVIGRALRISSLQTRQNTSRFGNVHKVTLVGTSRNFSKGTMSESKIVEYDEVVTYKDRTDVLLIDVRDPPELKETGTIPGSINIPLGVLEDVLKNGTPAEFKAKYGRDFPDSDANLVFSCKLGGRAAKAMEKAMNLGFVNSKTYKGSWTDWASRQK